MIEVKDEIEANSTNKNSLSVSVQRKTMEIETNAYDFKNWINWMSM